MELHFPCGNCGQKLRVTSELAGQKFACGACDAENEAPPLRLGPGLVLGGFLLEKHLGKGAMGDVFLGRQLSMDRKVAVKTLPPQMTINEESVGRFLNEVQMTAQMSHPNIVTAFDAGEDDGTYYLAMAYVDGRDCKKIVEDDGPFAEKEALAVTRDVAKALRYAWEEFKVLHRDVKPENIMIDRHDAVRLMDLGISKSLNQDGGLTMDGMVVGTPHYMSPEQAWAEGGIDCRADMYSVGATAYYLLSGRPPYVGTVQTVFQMLAKPEPIPPLREVAATVSLPTATLIDGLLVADSSKRPSTWTELLADLDRVTAGEMPQHVSTAKVAAGSLRQGGPGSRTKSAPAAGGAASFSLRKLGNAAAGEEKIAAPTPSEAPAPMQSEDTRDPAPEAANAVDKPKPTLVKKEKARVGETDAAPPVSVPPKAEEKKSALRLANREPEVPPQAIPPAPEETGEGGGKGPVLIGLAVAVMLVLGIAGYLLTRGGTDAAPATTPLANQPTNDPDDELAFPDTDSTAPADSVASAPESEAGSGATIAAATPQQAARWLPIGATEREQLQQQVAAAVKQSIAAFDPDRQALARKSGLPWPLPTATPDRRALEEETAKEVAERVNAKYPAHSLEKYLGAALERYGPFPIGKPITLQLRFGKGVVSGTLREVGLNNFKLDETEYPLHHLNTTDRDRMSEVKAKAKAEVVARNWFEANEAKRTAYAAEVRPEVEARLYGEAGLIRKAGGWVSATEILAAAVEARRQEEAQVLAEKLEQQIYTAAGYEERAGIWGRTKP